MGPAPADAIQSYQRLVGRLIAVGLVRKRHAGGAAGRAGHPPGPQGYGGQAAGRAVASCQASPAYLPVRQAGSPAAAKAIVKKPVAAYVEKVYEEGDFSQLGIGT